MSKISREDLLKLARLARLSLTEDEIEHFSEEIGEILQYVEQLQDIDLSAYAPTAQVTGLQNVTRADKVIDYGVTKDALLQNVPAVQDGQIKVKRMIG